MPINSFDASIFLLLFAERASIETPPDSEKIYHRCRASLRFAGPLSTFYLCASTGCIRRMVRALYTSQENRVLQFDIPRQSVRTLSRPAESFACGPSRPIHIPFLRTRRLHTQNLQTCLPRPKDNSSHLHPCPRRAFTPMKECPWQSSSCSSTY